VELIRLTARCFSGPFGRDLRVRDVAVQSGNSSIEPARDPVGCTYSIFPCKSLGFDTWLSLCRAAPEQAGNPVTRRRFAEQWSQSNPRFRAAHAAASYLEREGIALLSAGGTMYADEREVLDPQRPRADAPRPRHASHGRPR
jgi:hypothetical protein